MTARGPARRLFLRAVGALFSLATVSALSPGCYSAGGGTAPPPNAFYFPVGLAVSSGGNALYAANSDFDLQWNGGTLQSYDLFHIRHDAAELITANFTSVSQVPLLASDVTADIQFIGSWQPGCTSSSVETPLQGTNGSRVALGQACAPPVKSSAYIQDSVIIGAFATDLQLSRDGSRLFAPVRGDGSLTWADVARDSPNTVPPGAANLADLDAGGVTVWDGGANNSTSPSELHCGAGGDLRCDQEHHTGPVPDARDTRALTLPGEPFALAQTEDGTALAITHQTGTETSLLLSGLAAMLPMPTSATTVGDGGVEDASGASGVDSGALPADGGDASVDSGDASVDGGDATVDVGADATTDDSGAPDATLDAGPPGTAMVDAGAPDAATLDAAMIDAGTPDSATTIDAGTTSPVDVVRGPAIDPSMQFIVSNIPVGGDGIVAVPHDPDGPVPPCENVQSRAPCVRPAFLQTSHNVAEIDLLRYYSDDGSSIPRPFLVREAAYPLSANSGGTDSRGIVIDSTPRQACKSRSPGDAAACAKIPARVFFASRTPPALVIGEIGEPSTTTDTGYDPDRLVITGNLPISNGASRVYLAPIVDRTGHYALRVFVVCFDAAQIFVYDPEAGRVENVINVGPGPFAMAFDPFDINAVAQKGVVAPDKRQKPPSFATTGSPLFEGQEQDPSLNLKSYRFAYVASFTQSFVQVIDLDDSLPTTSNVTFEHVVFTLGQPTNPKGQ